MKILHVIHRFLPEAIVGGTTTYLADLCKEQQKNHEVRVFCGGSPRKTGPVSEEIEHRGIPITKVYPAAQHWRWSTTNVEVNGEFKRLIEHYRPDVVHCHSILLLSNDIPALSKDSGIPVLYTLHDQWFVCLRVFPFIEWTTPPSACFSRGPIRCCRCMHGDVSSGKPASPATAMARLAREMAYAGIVRPLRMSRTFRSVDRFLAPSRWIMEYYARNGFPRGKVSFCGYGIDAEPYKRLERSPHEGTRFGFLGGPHYAKGLHVLLEAMRGITGRAELHVFGKGNAEQTASNAAERIISRGAVTGQEKLDAFAELDVIVVPSLFPDNSPLTIHEARAAGIPVIGSRIGGIPEIIEDGVTGFLVPASDTDTLRERMSRFVNSPSLSNGMRESISAVKTIERNALELDTLYSDTINSRS